MTRLGSKFRENRSDITNGDVNALDAAPENMFKVGGQDIERQMASLSGSHDGFQKAGAGLAQSFNEAKKQRHERDRKNGTDTTYFLLLNDLTNRLNKQIDFLDKQIGERETRLEAQFGADWREDIAQRVLDPDDFPQRREGEALEDYHERLEHKLIEEMLEDGEIKPEYLNDPELREAALWAKDQHDREQAMLKKERINEIAEDPSLSEAEKEERLSALASSMNDQELYNARKSDDLHADGKSAANAEYDRKVDQSTVASSDVAFDNSGF